jgi:hypothetical protein
MEAVQYPGLPWRHRAAHHASIERGASRFRSRSDGGHKKGRALPGRSLTAEAVLERF